MDCYRFEPIKGTNPLFNSIDATYVLHLEGNGRLDRIKSLLREHYPSNNTFILFNKGYKKCKKKLPGQESKYDITDANLHVFKHAKEQNYKNILILEDDYFFHKDVRSHSEPINTFLRENEDNQFMYFLGVVPGIIIPYSWYHYRAYLTMATHAAVYSKSYRENMLNIDQNLIEDWDVYQVFNYKWRRYMYHRPICYQLFPETENSKGWGSGSPLRILGMLLFNLFQILKMNVQENPGYQVFYFLSKLLFWIILVVFFYIVNSVFFYCKKMKLISRYLVKNKQKRT